MISKKALFIGGAILLIGTGGGVAVYSKIRGIRNNNPGNLENNGVQWKGLSSKQTDTRFYQFKTPQYGIRALARTIKNYQNLYRISTLSGIADRYAPANENDTQAYKNSLSKFTGYDKDAVLDLNAPGVLFKVVSAIIRVENGINPYSDETIKEGIALA